ncbi:MAG: SDR family oxidoreductase, partial [Oceanococcaceae bacterium]
MHYFVTGATGFIGRFVVAELLQREGAVVHALIRESSRHKFAQLREKLGASDTQLLPVWGDVTQEGLTDAATRKALNGKVEQVYHLAAV